MSPVAGGTEDASSAVCSGMVSKPVLGAGSGVCVGVSCVSASAGECSQNPPAVRQRALVAAVWGLPMRLARRLPLLSPSAQFVCPLLG